MENLFTGIKVLDFTTNAAGPSAVALLADFGAEVFKIERPGFGDDNRSYGPFLEGEGLIGMFLNRNKKSMTIDTSSAEGKEICRELLKKCDVLVESFRPGAIAKMGFSYEEVIKVKPDIIMCSVSAFGQTGPYSKRAGYDIMAQAMSGLMSLTGPEAGPPYRVGTAIGDWCGGFHAFGAIASALYYRERTGQGQYIDISLLDGLMAANELAEPAFNGFPLARAGNHHGAIAPFGLFRGNDGDLMIGAVGEPLWVKLCKVMGREDVLENPDFSNSGNRAAKRDQIIDIVESWLKSLPSVDEAVRLMDAEGIPNAKIMNMQQVMEDPHVLARGMVADIKTSAVSQGVIKGKGNHLKFSKVKPIPAYAPYLGEHTEKVLKETLGYSDEKIAELSQKGAFGKDGIKGKRGK